MSRVDELPDDPRLLKQLLKQQELRLAVRETQIDKITREATERMEHLKREAADQADQIKREAAERMDAMEQRHQAVLAALLRRMYGPRSERFDPAQLLLFGIHIDATPRDKEAIAGKDGEPPKKRGVRRHGRGKLPDHLPRFPVEHDLPEAEKACPCCGQIRQRIGQEVSEQLEYIPAALQILKHIRYKYACGACERSGRPAQIEIAVKPPQPIEKGLPGPGLVAYVITSKLADHQPLYRLERILARHGVTVARSTMCAWLQTAAELVRPLERLLVERVRQSRVIHTDDTRVPVQAEGKCRSGRIWAYVGDDAHPYTIYDYTPDRTRDGPSRWLADYRGYLQADAYGGYDHVYAGGDITEVACWAHARRKFFDAKDSDPERSAQMLAMVRSLYAVESQARDLDANERAALRQERSVPILERVRTWLDTEGQIVLPRSPMAQAIQYVNNQWDALNVYTTQGFLNIDNNAAERAVKPVAIGRKNWLFAGNDRGGETAATLWTLIGSATRHGVDPQRYLTSVLAKIAATPINDLEQFLPDIWAREDAEEPYPAKPPAADAASA